MNRKFLEENFNVLFSQSQDLEVLQELFAGLCDQELMIDRDENVLYTIAFKLPF